MLHFRNLRRILSTGGRGAVLPVATLAIVVLMLVPVPSLILDIGFIANIALSLAVLMIALNSRARSISRVFRRCCCLPR